MGASTPLDIAIVGFSGAIGKRHVSEVVLNASTNLVALVDPAPASSTVASSLNVPYYASVGELLSSATSRPAAAIVCTPSHTHVAVATELAAAGIHILLEKPLSTSTAEGQQLVRFVRERGVQMLVGHHRRFNRHVVATKTTIEQGSLGDITAVTGIWATYKPSAYFDADPVLAWRSSRSRGGGPVMINLVHEVDLLQHFLGPITRVHAEKSVSRRTTTGPVDANDRAEEGAALVFRFQSGVVGTFLLSDRVVSPYSYEASTRENPVPLSALPDEQIDVYRILGTEASLSVPDMLRWSYGAGREKGWLTDLQRETVPVDDDPRPPFHRQLDHFVEVVRGEATPRCSPEEAIRAVLVCEVIKAALDSPDGVATVPDLEI